MIKLSLKFADGSEIKASGHEYHLAAYNLQSKLIKAKHTEILDSGAVYEAFNELTENDESTIEFEDAPENNFTITKVIKDNKEDVIDVEVIPASEQAHDVHAPVPAPVQES